MALENRVSWDLTATLREFNDRPNWSRITRSGAVLWAEVGRVDYEYTMPTRPDDRKDCLFGGMNQTKREKERMKREMRLSDADKSF